MDARPLRLLAAVHAFATSGRHAGTVTVTDSFGLTATASVDVSLTLAEAAGVSFGVQRGAPGRRAGGRCAKVTRSNRGAKSCTRWVGVKGGLGIAGKAGAQSLRFSGRWRGKALAPGSYRLTVAASNAGGRATARPRPFAIVR